MTEINPVDNTTIETLKGLMKDRFNFLIETFFTNTKQQIEELQNAIIEGNADNIISLTHAIKGSSGSVGAAAIHENCRIFEEKARAGDIHNCQEWAILLTNEFNRYKDDIQKYL